MPPAQRHEQDLPRPKHQVAAVDFTYQDALKLSFGLLPTQALPDMAVENTDCTVVAGVESMSAYQLSREAGFAAMLSTSGLAPFGGGKLFIADVAADDLDTREILMSCTLMPRAGVACGALQGAARNAHDGAAQDGFRAQQSGRHPPPLVPYA